MVVKTSYKKILKELDLNLLTIFEFGNCELTELILASNPRVVITYAKDVEVELPDDSKIVLSLKSFQEENFKWVKNGKNAVICIPDEDSVEDIKEIIDNHQIENVLITVPKNKKKLFAGFDVVKELSGNNFDPVRKGNQLVLRKGFSS